MTIGVDIQGIEKVLDTLVQIPSAAMDATERAAGRYLRDRLQKYPKPQKSIRRRVAFPETGDGFFTEKQRRWFWWALRTGRLRLPYKRTGALRQGWQFIQGGAGSVLINETHYAKFVQGDGTQSRQLGLGGWRTIENVIKDGEKGMVAAMEAATAQAMKKIDK